VAPSDSSDAASVVRPRAGVPLGWRALAMKHLRMRAVCWILIER